MQLSVCGHAVARPKDHLNPYDGLRQGKGFIVVSEVQSGRRSEPMICRWIACDRDNDVVALSNADEQSLQFE